MEKSKNKTSCGEEAVSIKSILDEFKAKEEGIRRKEIKSLCGSNLDSDIEEGVDDILKEEEKLSFIIESLVKRSKNIRELHPALHVLYNQFLLVKQDLQLSVNLAHLRKQNNTNNILIAFTILAFLMMCIQVGIALVLLIYQNK